MRIAVDVVRDAIFANEVLCVAPAPREIFRTEFFGGTKVRFPVRSNFAVRIDGFVD